MNEDDCRCQNTIQGQNICMFRSADDVALLALSNEELQNEKERDSNCKL